MQIKTRNIALAIGLWAVFNPLHAQISSRSSSPAEVGWHSPKVEIYSFHIDDPGVGMTAELKQIENIYDPASGRMVETHVVLLKNDGTLKAGQTLKAPKVSLLVLTESGARNGLYLGPGGDGVPTGDFTDYDKFRARVWESDGGNAWSKAPAGWKNLQTLGDATTIEIDLEAIRQNPTSANTSYLAEAHSMITHDYSKEQIDKGETGTDYKGRGNPQINSYNTFNKIDIPRVRIIVPIIDILEVISDQIAGNNANLLPTPHFTNAPNNPMLMGTRSGQNTKLRIKLANTEPDTFVGSRLRGNSKILGYTLVNALTVPLDFPVPAHSLHYYEVVTGYDINRNGKFDDSEFMSIFNKTPLAPALDPSNINDKIIIVDADQVNASKQQLVIYGNVPLTSYAGNLLLSFAQGATSVPGATTTTLVRISSTQPGLSHPVGARWNSSNQADTHLFTFPNGSAPSIDLKSSNALETIILNLINTQKASLISVAKPGVNVSKQFAINEIVSFGDTEALLRRLRMLFAFNKTNIQGKAKIHYIVITTNGASKLKVTGVEFKGGFEDLYDFSIHTKPIPSITIPIPFPPYSFKSPQIDLWHGAAVQAGHATLAGTTYTDSGKVFFVKIELDSGIMSNWNGEY